jgi:hypothetical protein
MDLARQPTSKGRPARSEKVLRSRLPSLILGRWIGRKTKLDWAKKLINQPAFSKARLSL